MRKIILFVITILFMVLSVEADQLYQVKNGDTLWNICDKYYHDPLLWPKLWQINPQITNPHLIYPGDVLRLKETPEELVKAAQKKANKQEVLSLKLSPQVVETAGYVLPQKEPFSGQIVKAVVGDKTILGKGDRLFVSFKPGVKPRVGSKWTIFRVSKEVYHPVTHKKIGYLHTILGIAKVVKLYPKVAEAEIITSYEVIYRGDYLKPYQKRLGVSLVKSHPSIQACILASKSGSTEIGWPDIVYLDVGAVRGVKPGQVFNVFRQEKGSLPMLKVGKLVIVLTTPQTATALVLKSKYAFHIGDVVK